MNNLQHNSKPEYPRNVTHWAVVLQSGKIPVKKRLPKYADRQVPVLRELIKAYPTGLLAVVDACGGEIAVWSPEDVAAMARQMIGQNAKDD